MASLSVVPVQASVKALCALTVAGPSSGVGPFVEQGPVEPFGFAVGPGAAGFDESASQPPCGAHPAPVGAVAVDQGVVGEQPPDAYALSGEPGDGAVQEFRAGQVFLIGVDLAVGQPGAVVDGGVDVVVADAGLLVPVGH